MNARWFIFVFLLTFSVRSLADVELSVRFLAQLKPEGVDQVLMVAEEQRSGAFALPIHNLSVDLPAPARQFTLVSAGDKEPRLATVQLPQEGKSFVVLLVVGENPGFTPIVIATDDPEFKAGQIHAYNASRKNVTGQVGSLRFSLDPRRSNIIQPSGAVEESYYNVALATQDVGSNQYKVINTSRWPVMKNQRTYLFFYDDAQKGSVSFRAVGEYIAPK